MSYFVNDDSTNLDYLQARLEATDLVPSHQPLLDNLTGKMDTLKKAGVKSLANLRIRLKTKRSLASLAEDSGIDSNYLALLRRVIEGFFPKPPALKVFDWLNKETIAKLDRAGVRNTQQLYEAALSGIDKLAKKAGLEKGDLPEFLALSDLSRIQWTSPTFARVLTAAGFTSAAMLAAANPEVLYEAIIRANDNARFYKGKVGIRDIKRLIAAAAYVPTG